MAKQENPQFVKWCCAIKFRGNQFFEMNIPNSQIIDEYFDLFTISSKQIEFQGNVDNILYLMRLIQDDYVGITTKFKTW